jgi:hypothetical protein
MVVGMKVKSFDRIAGLILFFAFAFSFGVALSSWNWFPEEGDWGHIAQIPPTLINRLALLLPWILLLSYLVIRRLGFKHSF